MKLIKILKENVGFKQFLIRSILLFLLILVIQLITQPIIQKIEIPQKFDTVLNVVVVEALVVAFIVFILFIKDKIKLFKKFKFNYRKFTLFFIIGLLFTIFFFYIRYFIYNNLDFALSNAILIISLRYFSLFLSLLFFAIAVYGTGHILLIIRKFKRELIFSIITAIIVTLFIFLVQSSWIFLSSTITNIEFYLLSLFFDNVISFGDFNLGVGSFIVNIGKVCSGVESISLFTLLYLFIFFLDNKKLNHKKMLLIYPIGLIGVFLVNIIRIFLLLLVGILYSAKLAVTVFHTNLGWILFILYFFVFWYFAYGWLKK